jgi:hypothetical protein
VKGGNILGEVCTGKEIILKTRLSKIGREDVDWIHLAQDVVQCRDLVNILKKIHIS